MSAEIEQLRQEVRSLQTMVRQLAARTSGGDRRTSYPGVFLAKDNGDGTFKEWTVAAGTPAEHATPRAGDIIDPAETEAASIFLAELTDFDGSDRVTRFVKVGGGGAFDIRWNASTHALEKTTVASPAESDWTNIVTFTPCPAPTP